MKINKIITIVATLLLTCYSSNALVGFGVYGGTEISTSTNDTNVIINPADAALPAIGIIAGEISNPWAFGGHIYVEIPIIPLTIDLAGGITGSSYDVTYFVETEEITVDDMPFGTSNFLATLKYRFIDPPFVKPYLAAGIGSQFAMPIATDAQLYEGEAGEALLDMITGGEPDTKDIIKAIEDIAGDLSYESRMIYNVGVGTKVKMPLIPIALHVDYRFNFTGENDNLSYMPETFHTINGSLGLNF